MAIAPPDDVLTCTPIYRMVHIDCLPTILNRDAIHAPSCVPDDDLPYISIHAQQTQTDRGNTRVLCGPRGVIQDYIGFYFGPRSPMLYRLHTGWNVQKVDQSNIIYLTSTAQAIAEADIDFVFTDRHTLAAVAAFRDGIADLEMVDFPIAYAEQWKTTSEHPDRQEKKQAEFLVHESMPWNLIDRIGVLNNEVAARVKDILDEHGERHQPPVLRKRSWYY